MPLTRDEYEQLLAAAPDYLKDIIVFALGTGCRKSEIFNLAWDDVTLKTRFGNGTVTIVGKGGKRRALHLNRTAYVLLKRLHGQRTSEYVFPSPRTGGKLEKVDTSFRNTLRKARIGNFRFHDLRHTAASWMVQSGADIYAVKNILGHASVNTTQRYAHQSPEYLGNQIRKLDNFLIDRADAEDGETSYFQAARQRVFVAISNKSSGK